MKVIDFFYFFVVINMFEVLDGGKFGSVIKELEEVVNLRMEFVKCCVWFYFLLVYIVFGVGDG